MAAYEKYDLSGGWYEYLLAIIEMHCGETHAIAKIEEDDDKKRELEDIACSDKKLLSDLRQYIRKDMTIKLFPSQTHKIVHILLESCLILGNDVVNAENEEHKAKKELTHLLKFCNKILTDVVEYSKSSTEYESEIEQEKENVPTEADTPDDS